MSLEQLHQYDMLWHSGFVAAVVGHPSLFGPGLVRVILRLSTCTLFASALPLGPRGRRMGGAFELRDIVDATSYFWLVGAASV